VFWLVDGLVELGSVGIGDSRCIVIVWWSRFQMVVTSCGFIM
jgi:hypothetical protein